MREDFLLEYHSMTPIPEERLRNVGLGRLRVLGEVFDLELGSKCVKVKKCIVSQLIFFSWLAESGGFLN